jgi:hypothetical protein
MYSTLYNAIHLLFLQKSIDSEHPKKQADNVKDNGFQGALSLENPRKVAKIEQAA